MKASRFETLIASVVVKDGHSCTELRSTNGTLHKVLDGHEQPRFGKQLYIVLNQTTFGLVWQNLPQTPSIS